MSALACFLYDVGYEVIGCDYSNDFDFNKGLKSRNIMIEDFNKAELGNYIYIISNAYGPENAFVEKIIKSKTQYFYYHDFISTLPGIHIAISGTHGKTTTTKMIVDMLDEEKIGYIIGSGQGGGVKNYKYLIYEACEYKEHFLAYHPEYLIITNIDYDHPDYYHSLKEVCDAFTKLSNNSKNVISSKSIDYKILEKNESGYKITIDNDIYELPFYGDHMIDNFICAESLLKKLGYSNQMIKAKIKNISLPIRRMEEYKKNSSIIVFDYAHHPTEIEALYFSLHQKYPNYLLSVFFEPHTYSRTIAYIDNFKKALSLFDEVYIKDVFASAREKYNNEVQKVIDEKFSMFKKYEKYQLKSLDFDKKIVYIFLGAGTIYKDAITNIMKMG